MKRWMVSIDVVGGAALLALKPRRAGWPFWLAVAGSTGFCIQTAELDALVWTSCFLG